MYVQIKNLVFLIEVKKFKNNENKWELRYPSSWIFQIKFFLSQIRILRCKKIQRPIFQKTTRGSLRFV